MAGAADPALGTITNATLALWPPAVRIIFLGWEVGSDVHTGSGQPTDNPCGAAYHIYCAAHPGPACVNGARSSWDPMTLLHAVRGAQPELYQTHSAGHNEVAPARGNNTWRSSAPPGGDGRQAYLLLRDGAGARAAAAIDALLGPQPPQPAAPA